MSALSNGGRTAVIALLALAPFRGIASASPTPDPRATAVALRALLAGSAGVLSKSSTCYGNYGQRGAPRIRDLLAVQLASLYVGDNVIEGQCAADGCWLSIEHRNGEDVSSTRITFRSRNGKAVAESVQCVMTP